MREGRPGALVGRVRGSGVGARERLCDDGPVIPVLDTPRLRLRPLGLDDLEALHAIQSDPEHMRYYPHPFSREESRAWIERTQERYARDGIGLLAVDDRETGEFLGNVGPCVQVVDGEAEVELGWSVTPARARQGIATEAAAACRDWVFASGRAGHVISLVRPENVPSAGVAEHLGMTVWKDVMWGTEPPMLHHVYRLDRLDA